MKYCPYCGSELPGLSAAFCTECGKALADENHKNEEDSGIRKKKAPAKKQRKEKREAGRKKNIAVCREPDSDTQEEPSEDYDGYYDDVRPADEGSRREELDKELIKKIVLLAVVVLVVAGACVALMYLL